jgi:hypothetical protein
VIHAPHSELEGKALTSIKFDELHGGVKMSTVCKAFSVFLLVGTVVGLYIVCQPCSEHPISVSITTTPQGAKGEEKIVLKAALNGSGLSHGEVRLNFAPTTPKNLVSFSGNYHSIKGYTDSRGVFISTWAPSVSGEYMIAALVSKAGCVDGETVCFLRVPESRQDRRLLKAPISISSSNRPGG